MKEHVFNHYKEFIGISEEIGKMEDSMGELKKNLDHTNTVLHNLKVCKKTCDLL